MTLGLTDPDGVTFPIVNTYQQGRLLVSKRVTGGAAGLPLSPSGSIGDGPFQVEVYCLFPYPTAVHSCLTSRRRSRLRPVKSKSSASTPAIRFRLARCARSTKQAAKAPHRRYSPPTTAIRSMVMRSTSR